MHLTIFGLNTIVKHGSEELAPARILPKAVDGSLHVCLRASPRPDAGTDTTPDFHLRPPGDGDTYVIRGRKVWITQGRRPSSKMVLIGAHVRTRRECPLGPGCRCSSSTLDPRGAVRAAARYPKARPQRGSPPMRSLFDDLVVPVECRDRRGRPGLQVPSRRPQHPSASCSPTKPLGPGPGPPLAKASRATPTSGSVFDRPIGQNPGHRVSRWPRAAHAAGRRPSSSGRKARLAL